MGQGSHASRLLFFFFLFCLFTADMQLDQTSRFIALSTGTLCRTIWPGDSAKAITALQCKQSFCLRFLIDGVKSGISLLLGRFIADMPAVEKGNGYSMPAHLLERSKIFLHSAGCAVDLSRRPALLQIQQTRFYGVLSAGRVALACLTRRCARA